MARKISKKYKAGPPRKTHSITVEPDVLILCSGPFSGASKYKLFDGEREYFERIAEEHPELFGGRLTITDSVTT
jgi:hypothetical protein